MKFSAAFIFATLAATVTAQGMCGCPADGRCSCYYCTPNKGMCTVYMQVNLSQCATNCRSSADSHDPLAFALDHVAAHFLSDVEA